MISSSRLEVFRKTGVLKDLSKSAGKYLCWSHFLIKLQATLKSDPSTGFFLYTLQNFKDTSFVEHHAERPLLKYLFHHNQMLNSSIDPLKIIF